MFDSTSSCTIRAAKQTKLLEFELALVKRLFKISLLHKQIKVEHFFETR